jgi:uncharacterized protein (TIGR00255 family)
MTGYGRGTCEVAGRRLVVELRSLNHRFLEVKLRLPWSDAGVELHITQLCRRRLDRGMVTVSVRDEGGGSGQEVRVDLGLAERYAAALAQLSSSLGLGAPIPLELIALQPGVLTVGEGVPDGEALWSALKPGLEEALDALVEARAREGAALAADLQARTATLEALAADLAGLTREGPEQYRRRLQARLERVLGESAPSVDPQRLAQEVAIMAEKVDVAEELTRFSTHLGELKRLLAQAAPAGRRLDFLTQELNREINTIGSKSQSAAITNRVVDGKAELERLREQIQNVE